MGVSGQRFQSNAYGDSNTEVNTETLIATTQYYKIRLESEVDEFAYL